MPPMNDAERALFKALRRRVDELHHRVFEINEQRIMDLFVQLHEQDKFAKADHLRLKALESRWGIIWKVALAVLTPVIGWLLSHLKAIQSLFN